MDASVYHAKVFVKARARICEETSCHLELAFVCPFTPVESFKEKRKKILGLNAITIELIVSSSYIGTT